MSEAPKLIWLQRPNNDSMSEWCGEVTWCEDKQNDDDTCYIKAGQKTIDITRELTDLRARCEKAEKDAELWQFLLREWFREDDQNSWCISSDALFADTPEALEKTAREWIKEQKEGKS